MRNLILIASSTFALVMAEGDTGPNGTHLEISRRLAYAGSEGYRIDCSSGSRCRLTRIHNGYEVKTVFVSKAQMERIAAQFFSSMRHTRRPASRGDTPMLFWQVSVHGNNLEGMISQEEMEAGDWDRGAVLNYSGLETKFISLLSSH